MIGDHDGFKKPAPKNKGSTLFLFDEETKKGHEKTRGNSDPKPRPRRFSIEEERDFLPSAANRPIFCYCSPPHLTFPLDPIFQKEFEDELKVPQNYLFYEKREEKLLLHQNGLFLNKENKVLNGCYLFVMLPNHQIYASQDIPHHSYLSGGLNVLAAGYMYFSCGMLITVSNESGHYKPNRDKMRHAIEIIFNHADNPSMIFEDHTHAEKGEVNFFHVSTLLKDLRDKNQLDLCQQLEGSSLNERPDHQNNRSQLSRLEDEALLDTLKESDKTAVLKYHAKKEEEKINSPRKAEPNDNPKEPNYVGSYEASLEELTKTPPSDHHVIHAYTFMGHTLKNLPSRYSAKGMRPLVKK